MQTANFVQRTFASNFTALLRFELGLTLAYMRRPFGRNWMIVAARAA